MKNFFSFLMATVDGYYERVGLKLTKSRPFDSGNVLLHYAPASAGRD